MTTGFVHHERYLWHDTRSAALYLPAGGMVQPGEHAENPESKRRMRSLLEVSAADGGAAAERYALRKRTYHRLLSNPPVVSRIQDSCAGC